MAAAAVVGAVEAGGKLIDGIGKFINILRGKDPVAAAQLETIVTANKHELEMAQVQQENEALKADVQIAQMQTDVNKVEAASEDPFVSRWRPFIGWTCGAGLACQFVIFPTMTWIAAMCGKIANTPNLDMGTLLTLLLGMLGLGGMRTYEKVKGASKAA